MTFGSIGYPVLAEHSNEFVRECSGFSEVTVLHFSL